MHTAQPGTISIHGTRDRRKTIGLGDLKKCTVAVDQDFEAGLLEAVGPLPPFVARLGDWGEVERPEGVAEGQTFDFPLSNARFAVTMLQVEVLPGPVPKYATSATRTRQGKPIKQAPLPALPKIPMPNLDSLISWHGYGSMREMDTAMEMSRKHDLTLNNTAITLGEWSDSGSAYKRSISVRYGGRNYLGCITCADPFMKAGEMRLAIDLVPSGANNVGDVPLEVRTFVNHRVEAMVAAEHRQSRTLTSAIAGGGGQAVVNFEEYAGGRAGSSASIPVASQSREQRPLMSAHARDDGHYGYKVSVECAAPGCKHVTVQPIGMLDPDTKRCTHRFVYDPTSSRVGAIRCANDRCGIVLDAVELVGVLRKVGVVDDPYVGQKHRAALADDVQRSRDQARTLLVENAELRREVEQLRSKAGKR